MKQCLFVCSLVLLGWSSADAATVTAANCEAASVSTAANAAANGDTVIIPAGSCTWSSTVSINKGVTLQGQGVGVTVILDAVTSGPLMWLNLVANQTSRVTGIEFRRAGGFHEGTTGIISVIGSSDDSRRLRIDHCYFNDLSGVAIVSSNALGVIDHNTYVGTPTSRFVNVWNHTWGNSSWGDGSYVAPTGFGTEKFLFIEDNNITYLGSSNYAFIDGFGGARYVVRHNTITRGWVEAHGTDSGGRYRGTRAVEVYNNTFIGNDQNAYIVNMRSAAVLVHNNTASGYMSNPRFELANYRANQSFQPWGMANGSNPWDKNVGGQVVTALDQPCVSGGSRISGDTPVLPWTAGSNDQVVDACYEWNNTEDGLPVHFEAGHANIKPGIHFFNGTPKPGYVPFTYPHPLTTGSSGGSGPLAPANLRILSSE